MKEKKKSISQQFPWITQEFCHKFGFFNVAIAEAFVVKRWKCLKRTKQKNNKSELR